MYILVRIIALRLFGAAALVQWRLAENNEAESSCTSDFLTFTDGEYDTCEI